MKKERSESPHQSDSSVVTTNSNGSNNGKNNKQQKSPSPDSVSSNEMKTKINGNVGAKKAVKKKKRPPFRTVFDDGSDEEKTENKSPDLLVPNGNKDNGSLKDTSSLMTISKSVSNMKYFYRRKKNHLLKIR